VDVVGSHHATENPFEDDSLLVDSGLVQRVLTNPGVLLFLVLTAIALVAERSLFSTSPLGGGALVPAWGGASALWSEYLQAFHPAGIGTAAAAPPYVAVIALLASLLGGKPWLAVDVILIGCIPLAGVTAYLASRRITRSVLVRVWAALAYALLPVGMGAVAAGRLGTALVLVLLPLIAAVAARIFTRGRRRARRAAWAAGLLVAVAAAFVPLVWVITVAAMAIGALVFRRGRPAVMIDAAIVAVVPVVLLLPWSVFLATHPSQLFLEAGLQPSGLATRGLAARSLLLLSPGGPGLPPFWVTAGLVVAAVVALVWGGRRALVVAGWSAALLGLFAAAAATKVSVTPAAGGDAVRVWPGPALAFAGAGLLLAVLASGDALAHRLGQGRWRTPAGIAVIGLAAVACTAPALAAASWLTTGVQGPVAPVAGPVLPEFVSVISATGLRQRTLVLRVGPHGTVGYSVLRDTDPLIGASELATSPAAQRALNLSVAALTAPYGGSVQDQGRSLAQLGIGYVLLPVPIDTNLARLLDGVPGLRPVSQTSAFALWRVTGTSARVRVVEPSGAVVPVPSGAVSVTVAKAPAAGGTLVLAEPAGGWSAALNGHPLTPLAAPVDGWAQGFRLPPGGGSLTVGHSQLSRLGIVLLEGLAVAVVVGLGLPGARVAGEADEGAAAASAARRRSAPARDSSGPAPDQGDDRTRERRSPRRGKGKPSEPSRPRVRRPPAPAAQDVQRAPGAAMPGAAMTGAEMPGAEMAGAEMAGTEMAGARGGRPGRRGGSAPTGPLPGGVDADSPTMVTDTRGGAGLAGHAAPRPSTGGPGVPGGSGGPPPRDDPGPARGRPRHERRPPPDHAGTAGYQPAPGSRAVRPGPGPSPGPDRERPPGTGPAPGHGGLPGYGPDPGRGVPGPSSSRGRPDPGRGRPGYDTGPGRGPRRGREPEPDRGRAGYRPDPARGRPGYDPSPDRDARPGYDPPPDQDARAGYDPPPGRDARAGYDPPPGRDARAGYDPPGRDARPYDTSSGRDSRAGYSTSPGRDARAGYDISPGRDGRPGYPPDPARGRPGYDTSPGRDGRPGYDMSPGRDGPADLDPSPGRDARPGYDPAPGPGGPSGYDIPPGRRGRRGRQPEPDRSRVASPPDPRRDVPPGYGPPAGPPAERGGLRGRIGWPGRGGRSSQDQDEDQDQAPARGERPSQAAPRGRPPGGGEALSPLPPLPPRRPRPMDGYDTDGGQPGWDAEPQRDPGEADW
jgi:hypothetical protein